MPRMGHQVWSYSLGLGAQLVPEELAAGVPSGPPKLLCESVTGQPLVV